MKRLMLCAVVLAIVASMSFALEVGGSTSTDIIGNEDETQMFVDQEVNIGIGILGIDASFGLDYFLPAKEHSWDYELGADVTFGIFTVGGTFGGDKDAHLGDITTFADIRVENVGMDIDFLFSADETKDRFQGADFSAFFNTDWLEARIGYLWTEHGEPDINAPELLTGGGLYARAKIIY